MIKAFSEFIIAGMAFTLIVLVSFLFGYRIGQNDLSMESNRKIYQALKLEVE